MFAKIKKIVHAYRWYVRLEAEGILEEVEDFVVQLWFDNELDLEDK